MDPVVLRRYQVYFKASAPIPKAHPPKQSAGDKRHEYHFGC